MCSPTQSISLRNSENNRLPLRIGHPPNGTSSRTPPHYYFREQDTARFDRLSLRGSQKTCQRYHQFLMYRKPLNWGSYIRNGRE